MSKTTKRPWRVVDRRRAALKNIAIMSGRDDLIADMYDVCQRDPQASYNSMRDNDMADAVDARGLANAELIVKAVNAHEALVSALGRTLTMLKSSLAGRAIACADEGIMEAETALALAEGNQQ